MVDEAPCEMTAAGDVVELAAEVAVADVLGPECEGRRSLMAAKRRASRRAASREESGEWTMLELIGHNNLLRSLSNRLNAESAVDST